MSTHHQTIVVELGCSRIKVGFAGESKPRHVLSGNDSSSGDGSWALGIDDGICTSSCTWHRFYSYLSLSSPSSAADGKVLPKITTSYEWEKSLYPLFSYILTSILFIQRPSRHRMLVLMSDIFPPQYLREALLRVLLGYLNLGGVLLVNGGCFGSIQYLLEGMHNLSIPSVLSQPKASLVVDIGTNEARVAVSVPGSSFLAETYQAIPAGYQTFLREVLILYQKANEMKRDEAASEEDWTTTATLEDANTIVQAWITAPNTDLSATKNISVRLPSLLKQSNKLSDSSESSRAIQLSSLPLLEAFHQVYLDYSRPTSLTYAILDSALASPIDFRKAALQNVILLGGGAVALRSFGKGLRIELENAIKVACGVSIDGNTQSKEEEKKDDGLDSSPIARRRFQCLRAAVASLHGSDEQAGVQIKYPQPFSPDLAHWLSGSVMGKLRLSNEDWISDYSNVAGARAKG